jgi:hypothetical protein
MERYGGQRMKGNGDGSQSWGIVRESEEMMSGDDFIDVYAASWSAVYFMRIINGGYPVPARMGWREVVNWISPWFL